MKIEWTEPAVSDLESIRDFIAKDSNFYAKRFIMKVIESVGKLTEFPKMGRKVPESNDNSIRELLFHNYRIIYKIEKEKVLILAIVHGSRDLNNKTTQPWDVT